MRLPRHGEAKAMRLRSIAKMAEHVPVTKGALRVARELQALGLLERTPHGAFVLSDFGRAHLVALDRQRDELNEKTRSI